MDKQTKEAKEMVKNLPFKDKVKHFWYYYKIHTIAIAFILLLVGITIYQSVTQEKYDLEISYYGDEAISDEQKQEIEEKLAQYIEDVDGDGLKKVNLVLNSTLNEGEYAMYGNMKFTAEVSAGTYRAYILDEAKYKTITGDGTDGEDDNNDEEDDNNDEEDMIFAFDMRESEKCKEIFKLGDSPIYFCAVKPQNPDKAKKEEMDSYNNAVLLGEALKGE